MSGAGTPIIPDPDTGVAGRPSPWSLKTAVRAWSPRRPGINPNSRPGFEARILQGREAKACYAL